ncbi:MAG: peptidase T, partial [Lachnospiraceae bacterium]
MRAYERLLNYVVVRTPSDENSETVPSSKCQFNLANLLVKEL